MRYDNWDVILFPRDSHVPIQEFKTACYISRDEYGHPLPTLTCYISSLPPSTPFRVSVHSWADSKPSVTLFEKHRRKSPNANWWIGVSVDGTRVFQDSFDSTTRWPQEIVHKQPDICPRNLAYNHRKEPLQFPPFQQRLLSQTNWDARDHNGRINVLLSENSLDQGDKRIRSSFGDNEVVCFSFQHAPRDILEQAGISWPIRNPLYMIRQTGDVFDHRTDSASFPTKKAVGITSEERRTPLASSTSKLQRPQNPEPNSKPSANSMPQMAQFPHLPAIGIGRGIARSEGWQWNGSSTSSRTDSQNCDDINMSEIWSNKRSTRNSTNIDNDISMADSVLTSAYYSHPKPRNPWNDPNSHYESLPRGRYKKDKERKVVVTLRDDQFGQLVEAMSPPKQNQSRNPHDSGPQIGLGQDCSQNTHPQRQSFTGPPRMVDIPFTGKPSAAAMARTSSYPELNADSSFLKPSRPNRPSPDKAQSTPRSQYQSQLNNKENSQPPSQSRLPTPYPVANRAPTPNPFALGQGHDYGWDENISVRNPSSLFPSVPRFERENFARNYEVEERASMPEKAGGIRSRKEGPATETHQPPQYFGEFNVRHDQSLLPDLDLDTSNSGSVDSHKASDKVAYNSPASAFQSTQELIDIIDPELEKKHPQQQQLQLKRGHTKDVSSVDSTGRLERQLYSALGGELNISPYQNITSTTDNVPSHPDHNLTFLDNEVNDTSANTGKPQTLDSPIMGPELARALGKEAQPGKQAVENTHDTVDPGTIAKRKRQGTFGADRDRSPMMKMVSREEQQQVEAPKTTPTKQPQPVGEQQRSCDVGGAAAVPHLRGD